MLAVTLLGTGGPLPDPDRAGPATLVEAGGERYLVDAGRGVLMRLAALGIGADALDAVLLTHLHSDHITDLHDVITTGWITSFDPAPLRIVGPPGTRTVVDRLLDALAPDIAYRLAHHDDLDHEPRVEVTEVLDGPLPLDAAATITAGPTDHRPVEPSVAYRIDHDAAAVVLAGDTVPCASLDRLCDGAEALVHTVIRADVVAQIPLARLQDILDYHSSVEQAAQTAARASVDVLVLTHYVPAPTADAVDEWRARATAHFSGRVEVGDDLLRVELTGSRRSRPSVPTPSRPATDP